MGFAVHLTLGRANITSISRRTFTASAPAS